MARLSSWRRSTQLTYSRLEPSRTVRHNAWKNSPTVLPKSVEIGSFAFGNVTSESQLSFMARLAAGCRTHANSRRPAVCSHRTPANPVLCFRTLRRASHKRSAQGFCTPSGSISSKSRRQHWLDHDDCPSWRLAGRSMVLSCFTRKHLRLRQLREGNKMAWQPKHGAVEPGCQSTHRGDTDLDVAQAVRGH